MRLLSLNIWGGTNQKKLFEYLAKQALKTDVFCFQEVFDSPKKGQLKDGTCVDLYKRLCKLLPGYQSYFFPAVKNVSLSGPVNVELYEGLAIFVKRHFASKLAVKKRIIGRLSRKVEFKDGKENSVLQGVKVILRDGKFLKILNFHGISRPGDKLDSKLRILQSKKVVTALKKIQGPKILCGDFNLMPKTRSIKIIENAGFQNLITKYKIKSTRNTNSWKTFNNRHYYADFTFISPEVNLRAFKVPYNLVSDHLPMIVEFGL